MQKKTPKAKLDKAAAKKYVDTQVKTLKKDGTNLSKREYKTLLRKVAQALAH